MSQSNASNSIISSDLRHISAPQFRQLGLQEMAYIRPVRHEGAPAVGIHAADGTPMAIVADEATALAAIRDNNLAAALIH
ncbi:DUF1150 family protein [Oecophyllibacter saccharovorans]|uniref:DUF1150 family protein n=1 Tax=Oecophyllibacter saccharovorans TaxID=2558360 RepID=A0A506UQ37_9PROT|nr:DUF1150 family protein [Oecophyllibacter saccharovorans]QDH15680.1 DUF1150 family protein [Oecophyllibacter saccharovorans]TPW35457.1 DUF1150 family protein [Oecophyllibacter saccharovorans]TPW36699.1 DUF1150 family protein [Oecophyllibacter saccharovorans]